MARPRSASSAIANPSDPQAPSFEDAMGELEEIVHALESEPLPLDDLVGKYERGMNLLRQCRQQIDSAQLRIEQITQRGDAPPAAVPFSAVEPASVTVNVPVPPTSPPRPPAAAPTSADDEIRLF